MMILCVNSIDLGFFFPFYYFYLEVDFIFEMCVCLHFMPFNFKNIEICCGANISVSANGYSFFHDFLKWVVMFCNAGNIYASPCWLRSESEC